jgi:murein DD-endopeptidase MepM/ murein hydrolase activator NlpD
MVSNSLIARLVLLVLLVLFTASISAQGTTGATIHVVQRGETLFSIAQRYGLSLDVIAAANGIINPSNIITGQRLLIPLNGATETISPETYTVQYADNLEAIARAFSTDVNTLIRLNGLTDPNALYVGQMLILREGATPLSEIIVTDGLESDAETVTIPPTIGITATHRVQAGETLFRIAQRYGVPMADIQVANNITDSSRIFTGQDLLIPGVEALSPVASLPTQLAVLDLTPLILVEGKTGRVRLKAINSGAQVDIQFLGQPINMAVLGDGLSHIGFAPIPLGTVTGVYPMTITVTDLTGVGALTFNVQVNAGGYGAQYVTLPENKLELLTPAVEQNEMDLLRRITGTYSLERFFGGPMGLPAAAAMYSAFGAKRAYNGGDFDRYHSGADFAGAPGTPVIAPAPGRVVLADALNIRGTTVVLDHGWGVYTLYAHMNERYVGLGEFVQVGQALGTIGSTGRATGAHLHWEVWIRGIPVDPMQWVYEAFP